MEEFSKSTKKVARDCRRVLGTDRIFASVLILLVASGFVYAAFIHKAKANNGYSVPTEVKFLGTALSYFSMIGAWGWNVTVDQVINGPPELQNKIEQVYLAPLDPNLYPPGYMDPNIESGDKVAAYGLYQGDNDVALFGSSFYYVIAEKDLTIQISTPTFESHLRQKTMDEYLSDPSLSIAPQNDPWMDVTISVEVSPSNMIQKVELKTSGTSPDTNTMDWLSDDTYSVPLQESDQNGLIELVSHFVGEITGIELPPILLLWEAPRIKEIVVTDVFGNVYEKDFDIVLPTLANLPKGNSFGTMLSAICPIDVLVTDSQNRSVGAVYQKGTFVHIVNGIPGSSYIRPSPEGLKMVYLPFSTESYSVQVFGNATGSFNVTIVTVTIVGQNTTANVSSQSGQIQQGQTIELSASITPDGKISFIPEFPSFFILPMFVLATLLLAIIYGRKQPIKRFVH